MNGTGSAYFETCCNMLRDTRHSTFGACSGSAHAPFLDARTRVCAVHVNRQPLQDPRHMVVGSAAYRCRFSSHMRPYSRSSVNAATEAEVGRGRKVFVPKALEEQHFCVQLRCKLEMLSAYISDLVLVAVQPLTIPAAALAAQALLVQALPVLVRVVDGDLGAGVDALADEDDALRVQPGEALVLRVGLAAVVDEAREVALPPLPDLVADAGAVAARRRRRALHDVDLAEPLGDEPDELADGRPPLERAERQKPVVFAVGSPEHEHGTRRSDRTAEERWEAVAIVELGIV